MSRHVQTQSAVGGVEVEYIIGGRHCVDWVLTLNAPRCSNSDAAATAVATAVYAQHEQSLA